MRCVGVFAVICAVVAVAIVIVSYETFGAGIYSDFFVSGLKNNSLVTFCENLRTDAIYIERNIIGVDFKNGTFFDKTGFTKKKEFPILHILKENRSLLISTLFQSQFKDSQIKSDYKPTVFILAYHRSGSSFTGAVLARYPGAFYLFEPLHAIISKYRSRKYATFFNGTRVPITDSFLMFLRQEELRALATCDLKRLPYEIFFGFMHKHFNDSFASFSTCAPRNFTTEALECLNVLQERCLGASLRVIKFIRLRIPQVEDLLELYPHLKFIHLVRDPRGNALSQWKKAPGNVSEIATRYCQMVRNDTREKIRIFGNYSDRIYTLKYETLANYPLKYAADMLQFIDKRLYLTESMKEFIQRIALSEGDKRCTHCVDRGNGSKMASKWRTSISVTSYRVINKVCADVLDIFGYNRSLDVP